MVIRTKLINEMAFSIEEINALQVLAGVCCDGYFCRECPFNNKECLDNCVTAMARQILEDQHIPFTEHPNEEVTR